MGAREARRVDAREPNNGAALAMNQEILEFIGVWGFVISIIGFVITIILLAFNLFLIRGQLKVAKTQNETQIEIAKEQFKTQREIAERQFQLEVLSRNRQEWINRLREEIAQFESKYTIICGKTTHNAHRNNDQIFVDMEALYLIYSRITLALNFSEVEHEDLLRGYAQLIEKLTEVAKSDDKDALLNQIGEMRPKLRKTASGILKREWERVKRGE